MLPISSPLSAGSALLQQAQSKIDQHGGELAQVTDASPMTLAGTSIVDSLTGLQQAETYALSGLQVIQTTDNVIGTLLDIRA